MVLRLYFAPRRPLCLRIGQPANRMEDVESHLLRGWRLSAFLIPLLLFSLGLSQMIGYFDSPWLSHGRNVLPPLPYDLQLIFGLGQTAKWTPAAILVYWVLASMPRGLGRWLLAGDIFFGVAIMAFAQLLICILYSGGSLAVYMWR